MSEASASHAGELQADDALQRMAQRLEITATVEGPSYSTAFRCTALMILLTCAYGAWQVMPQLLAAKLSTLIYVLLLGCAAMVAYTVYWVFAARTTITPTLISQRYVFDRRMHLGELAAAKFIYIPYLTWLIAPRLFIRSASGKFTAIYGASPELHAAFGQIHRIVNRGY